MIIAIIYIFLSYVIFHQQLKTKRPSQQKGVGGHHANEPNLRKWQKAQFLAQLWPLWCKFGLPNFFLWILSVLGIRHCYTLSLYAISRKTNEPNLRKWKKPSFRPDFGPFGQNSSCQIFFQKLGSVSLQMSWSAIIMYTIRKNQ